jgi:hypothetical protein
VNGVSYTATIAANGTWSAPVSRAAVAALTEEKNSPAAFGTRNVLQ